MTPPTPEDSNTDIPIPARVELIYRDVKEIKDLLTGGKHPEDGIVVRMDRLEQAEKQRAKWSGAAIVAAITAVVTAIGTVIFK